MTKIMTLQERGTGVTIYPETSAEAVYCNDGSTVEAKVMKLESEERSNIYAEEPLSPDNFPNIDVYTREELKMDLFIDMWESEYDCQYDASKTKPFTCNGVELTYKEAVIVYNSPRLTYNNIVGFVNLINTVHTIILGSSGPNGVNINISNNFRSVSLECVRLAANNSRLFCNNISYSFYNAINLVTILGCISLVANASVAQAFGRCSKLTNINIENLNTNISFSDSSSLSLESITFMVANANNTSPITITLHSNAYARVTDEIFEAALAKNITITSA